jgi:hypothetical protein
MLNEFAFFAPKTFADGGVVTKFTLALIGEDCPSGDCVVSLLQRRQ